MSMNVSLTSALASSCQAYLCANQTDFNLNPVDLECMPEQSLAAGVPTLLTNISQTNVTLRQGDYLFLSLYLNCSAPASGNVSIYYNYTGEPAGLKAPNAIPTLLNSFTSARIQLENSYLIGPFQELNTSRITYVTFNNTQAHPFYTEYNFVSQILPQYPNSNIPNTIYVYNSTGGLWASDNVSAGAPNVAVSYSDNHESWLTEVFPANTALNESLEKNILNGIRDNESLVSSTPDVKSWNISVFTIFNNAVTLYNVTAFTNYSAYNAQDNFTFMVNFTNGSGTYDISSFVVKNTTAKTLTFPVMNLTGAVSFTVYAINTTAPVITFVNPTPANGSSRNLSWAYINVTADKNLTLAILDWNGTNYTMDGSGANWFFNETGLSDGIYTYTVFANDTVNNVGASQAYTILIDTTPPLWSNPSVNTTPVYWNQTVSFNTSWANTGGLYGYIFSTNQSGSWANSSLIQFSGSSNTSLNISTIIAPPGTTVGWYFWANDSAGNSNQTSVQTFIVQNRTTYADVQREPDQLSASPAPDHWI